MQLIPAYEAEQRKKMYGAYGGGGPGGDMASPGTTELTSVCYEYSYPDPNCNTRDKSREAIYSIGKSVSEHHYEQPMVIMPSRSPVDSIIKPLISDTSSSSTGGETIIIGCSDHWVVTRRPMRLPCPHYPGQGAIYPGSGHARGAHNEQSGDFHN